MNYLAHFYLAGESKELLVGNFIADFVKGNLKGKFDPKITIGIEMHRFIDTYTDSHKIVLETKKRLYHKYHKYASVIVDIYYDHVLAKFWNDYSNVELQEYANGIYKTLRAYNSILPKNAINTLHYMELYNWLFNYSTVQGIQATLSGLSRRTKFDSGMENAWFELEQDFELISNEFRLFFPELNLASEKYRKLID